MLQVRVLPGVQNFISMDIFRQTYQAYIEAIGAEPNNSRTRQQVEIRAAFANATSAFFHHSVCSNLFNKDRTTIYHYKQSHEMYFVSSPEYRTYFETASRIVLEKLDSFKKEDLNLEAQNFLSPHEQIDTIKGIIETLEAFKDRIQIRLRRYKPRTLQEGGQASVADDDRYLGQRLIHRVLRDERLQVPHAGREQAGEQHGTGHGESEVVREPDTTAAR